MKKVSKCINSRQLGDRYHLNREVSNEKMTFVWGLDNKKEPSDELDPPCIRQREMDPQK